MATITAVVSSIKQFQENTVKAFWETLLNTDVGSAHRQPGWAIRHVQVTGTFGGATVTMQGSHDGTNWATLNDLQGDPITISAAGITSIQESTLQIRPNVTGGDGTTDLDVALIVTKRGK